MKYELILGSQSPRRRRLLRELGVPFRSVTPEVEELESGLSPKDLVQENAFRKWCWFIDSYADALVLTADTIVELDGVPLGKPRDLAAAEEMLGRLSGRAQLVHTGYVLARPADADAVNFRGVETSRVIFKELTQETIRNYIDRVQPFDRAGSYDIDESGDLLIARLEGSRTNVMGLPTERISTLLARIS
jgi:septum formation protein